MWSCRCIPMAMCVIKVGLVLFKDVESLLIMSRRMSGRADQSILRHVFWRNFVFGERVVDCSTSRSSDALVRRFMLFFPFFCFFPLRCHV